MSQGISRKVKPPRTVNPCIFTNTRTETGLAVAVSKEPAPTQQLFMGFYAVWSSLFNAHTSTTAPVSIHTGPKSHNPMGTAR